MTTEQISARNRVISKLRQDIIDRYNLSWDDEIEDGLGLIQEAKDNFEKLVDNLIEKVNGN